MKVSLRLQELLPLSNENLNPFIALIGQGSAELDCSGVEAVEADRLHLILSAVPEEWDFADLGDKVIDVSTLTSALAAQLSDWVNQRHGRTAETELNLEVPVVSEALPALDIFHLRDKVIDDYRDYIKSFLKIRDSRVRAFVEQELEEGQLWPNPLVQLNPSYSQGANITALISQGLLHPDCARYFPDYVTKYTFRLHQEQAFRVAYQQEPYVLTTGTGSGKSMTYVVPIFDDLLRHPEIKGVRAIFSLSDECTDQLSERRVR